MSAVTDPSRFRSGWSVPYPAQIHVYPGYTADIIGHKYVCRHVRHVCQARGSGGGCGICWRLRIQRSIYGMCFNQRSEFRSLPHFSEPDERDERDGASGRPPSARCCKRRQAPTRLGAPRTARLSTSQASLAAAAARGALEKPSAASSWSVGGSSAWSAWSAWSPKPTRARPAAGPVCPRQPPAPPREANPPRSASLSAPCELAKPSGRISMLSSRSN